MRSHGGVTPSFTRLGIVGLIVVALIVLPAGPALAHWHGGFWIGLGAGAFLTAPFWGWPYPYRAYAPEPIYVPAPAPVYVYPPASYPAYAPPPPVAYPVYTPPPPSLTTPTPSPLSPPPSAPPGETPGSGPPSPPGGPPQASSQQCRTVWIEGHWEIHVLPDGQRSTVWIPGGSRQICQ